MIPTRGFYIYRTDGTFNLEAQPIRWKHLEPHVKALLTDAQLDLERVGFDAEDQFHEEEWAEIESTFQSEQDDQGGYDESVVEELEFTLLFRGEAVVGFLFSTLDGQSYVASFLPLQELKEDLIGVPQKENLVGLILQRRRR